MSKGDTTWKIKAYVGDTIKMDTIRIGFKGLSLIQLARNKIQIHTFVNVVMNLYVL